MRWSHPDAADADTSPRIFSSSALRGCIATPPSAHSSSGARSAARVATTDDSSPAASTATSSSPLPADRRQPPAALRRPPGAIATSAQTAPTASPQPSSSTFSASDDREDVAAPVADRAEQRQLAPPLEHVAQQHGRQPDGAEQQAEPAERLERREVGVLDRWNSASRSAVDIASAPRSAAPCSIAAATCRRAIRRRVDEQEPVALLLRETASGSSRPTSAARPERCCRRAPRRAAAGRAGRLTSMTISSPSFLWST